jgi:Ca-activated chloride channel family protein
MSFLWPALLATLALLPLAVAWYARLDRRRQRAAALFDSLGLARGAARQRGLRHVPPALFLLSLAVLGVALARPEAVVSVPRIEGTVILAFDVSASMSADDLAPTRMEAAKSAARAFAARQPSGVEIGIVAFSDGGLTVQVPTRDRAAVLAAIDRLAPQRGTSLGNGILAALSTIAAGAGQGPLQLSHLPDAATPTPTPVPPGYHAPAAVVLLTDGDNTEMPDPLAAAQAATDRGVRVYTVGIGSAEGADINLQGFIVHTQLDEAMLRTIADLTGGAYYNAQSREELDAIYNNLDTSLVIKPETMEVTSILAGVSILAVLAGSVLSLAWFGRLP